MNHSFIRTLAAALTLTLLVPVYASSPIVVSQVQKTFSVPLLKAKVGDVVTFRNDDDFAHNVFSLSDTQSFDLGSYKKGDSRSLKLNKPGKIEVECAIHPNMKMTIEVSP